MNYGHSLLYCAKAGDLLRGKWLCGLKPVKEEPLITRTTRIRCFRRSGSRASRLSREIYPSYPRNPNICGVMPRKRRPSAPSFLRDVQTKNLLIKFSRASNVGYCNVNKPDFLDFHPAGFFCCCSNQSVIVRMIFGSNGACFPANASAMIR